MNTPMVSVCIPTYNGERFIENAIKSVLMQTYTDFELLIIDDASTDKTVDIINSFIDNRIRLLKNDKNIGMVSNWNRCLDESKGEYIQLLCHDDYLAKDCLEKKVKAFTIDIDICLVFNSTYIINDMNRIIFRRRPFRSEKLFDGKKILGKSFVCKNLFGEPSNVMFKKEISKKVGYFDDRLCYSIDWDYWIKLCVMGKVYYLDDYLMYFRVSNISATNYLLKNTSLISQDDKQFINNCINNYGIKIKNTDILFHKLNIIIRTYSRKLFYILINHEILLKLKRLI